VLMCKRNKEIKMGANDLKVNHDEDGLALIADDESNAKLIEIIEQQRGEIGVLMGMFPLFKEEIRSISAFTEEMVKEHERTFVEFKQSVLAQLMPGMLKLREQTINPMHWDSINEIKNISIGMDEPVFSETIGGVVSVFQKDLDELIATANRILE